LSLPQELPKKINDSLSYLAGLLSRLGRLVEKMAISFILNGERRDKEITKLSLVITATTITRFIVMVHRDGHLRKNS
jgi:hypothetical protein